jgi:hypothetical protein
VYGGTQDNNSQGGPSRTLDNSGIHNSDWFVTLGGDGHQSAVDPNNPNIVYAQWQQGNLARVDRATGETTYIRPQAAAGDPPERYNWDSPILISPHDSKTLFFATQRVWKSDDYGDSWTAISGDITRDERRVDAPLMGRTWSFDASWDLYAMSMFNTVTSLSESPLVAGLINAGTDDGIIQITEDNGQTWRKIDKLPGVPDRFFVNDIKADLYDADTVYVVVDDHKNGDFAPYILKSEDRGRKWKSIASNLPERHVLWRVVQDHVNPGLMFLGTEFGVFFTVNGGGEWTKLKGGSPNIPFRDLVIQTRENDLVGATFGRSFYILDDYTALRDVSADMLKNDITLFPVRKTRWYVPKSEFGCSSGPSCKAYQGDSYYVAPNPDFGANFTYYLAEGLQTRKDARRENEKEREAKNESVKFVNLATVIDEQREDDSAMVFTVKNRNGEVVRHIEGPAEAGFHRVAWNLRYPALDAWEPMQEGDEHPEGSGVLVVPGTFTVSMQKRVDGVLTDLGQSQSFEVVSIREPTLPGSTQEQRVVFETQVNELMRATDGTLKAMDAINGQLDAIKATLSRSTADASLHEIADSLQERLLDQRERLSQNSTRDIFKDWTDMSVQERLFHARFSPDAGAYGPTPSQRDSYDIGRRLYSDVVNELGTLVDTEYAGLKSALDQAKVPWTPGRGVQ